MSIKYVRAGEGAEFPGALVEMIFTCDEPGCGASPTNKDIIAGGGLIKMGWTTSHEEGRNSRHFCPKHKPKE